MLRVGLTGGIASGKSTILRMLARQGCRTVDADSIVASLYRPGAPGHSALVRAYGTEILLPAGEIDRPRLAAIAFASAGGAQQLNALIHPLVIEEEARLAAEAEAAGVEIYVVEATLLIEAGGRKRYDRIVVVDVPPEVQVERGIARGMSREDVLRRIEHQMARQERLSHADYVIRNDGTTAEAEAEVARVVAGLRRDLAAKEKASG